jgi:Domain of unknown function (DUF4383)
LVGLLGFVPAITPGGKLLGYFEVNAAHNIVHIVTGVIALAVGFASEKAARLFFQVFGVIYALVAVLGFAMGNQPLLGIVSNNTADTWLHVLIAIVSLYLGFGMKAEVAATSAT